MRAGASCWSAESQVARFVPIWIKSQDAVAAARMSPEPADRLLSESLRFAPAEGTTERLRPAYEAEWHAIADQVIRLLERATGALRDAFAPLMCWPRQGLFSLALDSRYDRRTAMASAETQSV